MLQEINKYRNVLENFSKPQLDLIEWMPDMQNNVEILNETVDLYRYFDATGKLNFCTNVCNKRWKKPFRKKWIT